MIQPDSAALPAAPPTSLGAAAPVVPSRGALRPLGLGEIRVTGGLWQRYQELNANEIIWHCLDWMTRIGWVGNFDRAAAGTLGADHAGIEFVDSEVYKLLEAMAWELGRSGDARLGEAYAQLVDSVGRAQETDGYLNTSFGREGQPARFGDLEWGHELYCIGHLLQAAVARLRTGHDDELPAIARRAANLAYREFGPDGRVAVCGHPEIEVALAEFSRATGDARYLELARLFVERRGTGTLAPIRFGAEYFQDDVPVRDADVLRGHAVRALYLAAGALDVAEDTSDSDLADAVRRQWTNTVARRTYITGGMGSRHHDEAFGADFELPPDRAYSETCAGIASVMLSWRLLLSTGGVEYADLIERTLLNNVLASPREDGHAFFYANPLQQRVPGTPPSTTAPSKRADSAMRAPWFEVSCCPTNVARTLATAPLYFATASDAGVQLHQYGEYSVRTTIGGEEVALDVESAYPYGGEITVRVHHAPDRPWRLSLRIPSWANDARWSTWGSPVVEDGYLLIDDLPAGAGVTLSLPMDARLTYPDGAIDAVRGQVAVERGPLVLALESVDLPEGMSLDGVRIDAAAGPATTAEGARVELLSAPADPSKWAYGPEPDEGYGSASRGTADLVPYYRWGSRGPSTMRVFTPIATD